jgi:hypothetical protein
MVEALDPASYSILGDSGSVGSALKGMAAKPEVAARHGLRPQPDMVGGRDGWWEGGNREGEPIAPITELPDSDVLFVSTPSTEDNEPMHDLVSRQLQRGGTVVTAEKRTVADHMDEFERYPGVLLTWACVGGGSMMIPVLRFYTVDPDNIRELALGTNGTLSAASDRFASGDSEAGVTRYILNEKMAEPGNTDLLAIGRTEAAQDVPAKQLILMKRLFPGRFKDLRREDFVTRVDDDHFRRAFKYPHMYRYLVDMFPEDAEEQAEEVNARRLGGFEPVYNDGFITVGGYLDINATTVLKRFRNLEAGPNAAFGIRLGPADGSTKDGTYGGYGDGAGPDPTATAMLNNYLYFRRGLTLL